MTAIGDAGSAVGVTAADMTGMARAMSRMPKFRQGDAGSIWTSCRTGALMSWACFADALGRSKEDIYKMVSKGEINGRTANTIIQQGMESAYSGAMDLMSETFSGLTSTLQDAMTEINAASGQGYNAVRSYGMQEEITAYDGPLGDAIKEVESIGAKNEAFMENLSEKYRREALSAVLLGEETSGIFTEEQKAALEDMSRRYEEATIAYENGSMEAGLTRESLYEQAEAFGKLAYESSEQYRITHETELDTIEAMRNLTTAFDGWKNRFEIETELSKGRKKAFSAGVFEEKTPEELGWYRDEEGYWRKAAFGLSRVPRDGLYYLHQDERVQTAREARSEGARTPIRITITGNTFGAGVTAEEMAQRLADAIERKLAAGVLS